MANGRLVTEAVIVDHASGPLQQISRRLEDLIEQTRRGSDGTGRLTDAQRRHVSELRAAQRGYDNLRKSIDPAFAQTKRLEQAQKQLQRAVRLGVATQEQANSLLHQYRISLDQASGSTNRFSRSMRGVQQAAAQQQRQLATLRAELNRLHTSQQSATTSGGVLAAQLRSQVAVFGSIIALYQGMRSALDQIATAEDATRRMGFLSDSAIDLGNSQRFVVQTSRDLAGELNNMRDSYARLSVFQQANLLTTDELRQITLGMIDAQSALGASNEQLKLAFFGLQQLLGRGKVSLEELNQVTEALPGLLDAMGRSVGKNGGELRQFIEDVGLSSREFVPILIAGLREFEGAAAERIDGVRGTFTRFFNELKLLAERSGPVFDTLVVAPFRRFADLLTIVNSGLEALGRNQPLDEALQLQRVRAIADELAIRGFPGMADGLRQIAAGARDGDTDIQALFERARSVNEQVSVLLQQRQTLQRRLATEEMELATRVTRRLLEERQKAIDLDIRNNERRIAELLRQEERFADEASSLRLDLAESIRTAEERAIDARRASLPEFLASYEQEKELAQRLVEVQDELKRAREAETEEARKAALASAEGAQERANSLAGQIDDQYKFRRALEDVSQAEQDIIRAKIALAEEDRQKTQEAREAEQARLQQLQVDLGSVQAQLDQLAEGKEVNVKAEVDATKRELREIQDQLDRLAQGVTIPIRTSGGNVAGFARGGAVDGFKRGGPVAASGWLGRPGSVGPDRIWIRAARGEAVLNRHQQIRVDKALREVYGYGLSGLFRRIRLPHTAPITRRLMDETDQRKAPGFATGGIVSAQPRTQSAASPGGDSMTLNLVINRRPVGAVTGPRETVRALNEALSQLARAT